MNKGILTTMFTFVTVYKTVDSNLKYFVRTMCTSLTAPIAKLQISITVLNPKFNKFTCAKGCFLGTEYTTHSWEVAIFPAARQS